MAWPKIKNIIILMLLVTNLCLLAFVGWREIRDWQLQDKALEQGRLLPGGAGHPGGRAHRCPGLRSCRPWAWNGTWRKSRPWQQRCWGMA